VTYQTDHMLEKNRDFVISEHQALLAASALPLAASLFPEGSPSGSPTAAAANGGAPRGGLPRGVSSSNLKGFQFVSVRV
jgi:myosin heavy subunit